MWMVQRPKGLHTRPAARLFTPEKQVLAAKNCREAQLLAPGNHTPKPSFGASFLDLAFPASHRIATAEHTGSEFRVGSRRDREESEGFWGFSPSSAALVAQGSWLL